MGAELVYEGDANETREQWIERTKGEGFDVVTPKANELFIDIDTEEQYDTYQRMLEIMERNGVVPRVIDERQSRSGWPCKHIRIQLPFDVAPWERIAWQAALGSDPARELLSAIRLKRGDVHPTLFVEEKA